MYGWMRDQPHTDEALLLSGEPEDFGRFYDRYVQSLLAYFQRRTRDPEVAADLTAETFAAALAARGRFRPRATPASVWLFAIAHHKLMDFHRRGSAEDRMRWRLGIARAPLEVRQQRLDVAVIEPAEVLGLAREQQRLVGVRQLAHPAIHSPNRSAL